MHRNCIRLLLGLTLIGSAAADELPVWMRQLSRDALPEVDSKAPAVVLLDDATLGFDEEGVATMTSRWVVKVIKREGREWADAGQTYETETGKVREFRAWLLKPDGTVKKYGKSETVDVSLVADDVYNQARRKLISAKLEAEAGSIFGYEAIHESRSIFTQYEWFFQSTLPVVLSRFRVALPPQWSAKGNTFNCPPFDAVRGEDRSYSWEMRDLPYRENQPMMPSLVTLVPRLAVNVFPAPGSRASSVLKTFPEWNDVARWLWELADTQMKPDAAVSAKAAELVNDDQSELQKLRAIGRFSQTIKYVSIQTGIGRGGGYKPHLASEILTKFYGDCKDKTNLMRSLLTALRFETYPVSVYAFDRNYIRPDWPSPQQFNHAIIAVKVSDQTIATSVVVHPELGRLLLFDPTDEHTPLGDIPENLQGSFALVGHPDTKSLLPIPVIPVESNCLKRTVTAKLEPNGAMSARISEHSVGQAAVSERSLYKRRTVDEYRKTIEGWISGSILAASIARLDCQDELDSNQFRLDVELTTPKYAQVMQNRLLVFRPALLSRREAVSFMEGVRQHPVEIEPEGFEEQAEIALPDGFVVDELPDSLKLESTFGAYESAVEANGNILKLHRRLSLKPMFLDSDKYTEVKTFFDRISAAEQAPAVLIRK
ncbi:MAG: DUF3857 domain-containing protein [Acidobacteria bacterium]|nr:MAG: DUF3857 domain-containing protein [Acidobacteriota bacterium]